MSDPHSSPESETDRDAEGGESSGEELLESEERVKEADRRDREERRADPEEEEPTAEEAAADDAEDVESEWHVWLLALIFVAGVALFFAPRFLLPELLGSLGVLLVVVGALGLLVKWAIEWSA